MSADLKAIRRIEKETGMKLVSTDRQIDNGTLMFRDTEYNESYGIYPHTGYARRINRWGGIYQLNAKGKDTVYWTDSAGNERSYNTENSRIRHIQDRLKLADIVIKSWHDRRISVAKNEVLKKHLHAPNRSRFS